MENNIEQSKLLHLEKQTQELIDHISNGIDWSDGYLKSENKQTTSLLLKAQRRKLRKIKNAITKKPAIALFGASQQGKSYLVKNVLCNEKNQLILPDHTNHSREYDFIKDINPEGDGSEATGVVTRFTYESQASLGGRKPVKIKVFKPQEIIIVLVDSYLSDFKVKKTEIQTDQIVSLIDSLSDLTIAESQNNMTEDDVLEIEEYLTKIYDNTTHKHLLSNFKDTQYWYSVASIINKIPLSNWGIVFEVLWGKQENITLLFNRIVQGLEGVGFSNYLTADFDVVLRSEGNILDVTVLKELSADSTGKKLSLFSENHTAYEIERSILCALTAEVILNISEDALKGRAGFIQNSDILDFPGARTRLKLVEGESISSEDISGMLLRGKVSYLFNSYSLNYEISNLFVCTGSIQSNVRELPELIQNWIEYNIGETPEKRSALLEGIEVSPLFVIFTFWNMQMNYDVDKDAEKELDYKWKHRFEKLFTDELLGSYKWNENWTPQKEFDNYYLLRDFKYSDKVFDGFETEKKEIKVKDERVEYLQTLKESFINSQLTSKFFSNKANVWEQTSSTGKDGSSYIIEAMGRSVNNKLRTQRYVQIIRDQKEESQEVLKKFYHDDDKAKQLMKAARKGSDIHATMNLVFEPDAADFSDFIEQLTLMESDIVKYYHEIINEKDLTNDTKKAKYNLFREKSPRLSTGLSYEENVEILRQDYNFDTIQEVEKDFIEAKGIDLNELFFGQLYEIKNRSLSLAERARDYWFETKLIASNFEKFIGDGFTKSLLEELFENLKRNFDNLNLSQLIAVNIRNYVDRYNNIDVAEDMIAHITVGVINNFVTNVGWTYYSDNKKEDLRKITKDNNLKIDIPQEEAMGIPNLKDVEKYFQDVSQEPVKNWTALRNYYRWNDLLRISFISTYESIKYNVEANSKLGKIIENIKIHQVSI